jgi:hypothetical protein
LFVKLQHIWDNDKDVYPKVFEQFATTSLGQSMANKSNKLKFPNAISLAM